MDQELLNDQIEMMLGITTNALEKLCEGQHMDRMSRAVAKCARKYYEAFSSEGFTNEHAIALTAACISSHTNMGASK
jgi:hypothetical protein